MYGSRTMKLVDSTDLSMLKQEYQVNQVVIYRRPSMMVCMRRGT
jgi:hypothetical protein